MRVVLITVVLLSGARSAPAQTIQPSAFSMQPTASLRFTETPSATGSKLAPPRRLLLEVSPAATSGLRVRPIVIGVSIGALLGAGLGYVLAGTCDGQHCSNRDEVTTGALVGAGVGSLFGLVLGLPPRRGGE